MNDIAFVPINRMGTRVLTLPHCSSGGGSEMLRDGDLTDHWALNVAWMRPVSCGPVDGLAKRESLQDFCPSRACPVASRISCDGSFCKRSQ